MVFLAESHIKDKSRRKQPGSLESLAGQIMASAKPVTGFQRVLTFETIDMPCGNRV
jgi:hypothetical protein